MKKNMKKTVTMVSVCLSVCAVKADPIILQASQDTFLRSAASQTDFGAATTMMVYRDTSRALLEYDLSSLSGTITNATFTFRMGGTTAGTVNLEVHPMVYTANNYSWLEGVGTDGNATVANADSLGANAATWAYRLNSTASDLQWQDASLASLSSASVAGLWGSQIGTASSSSWTNGGFLTITLDAATIETYRAAYGTISIGIWADSASTANGFLLNSSEAAVSGNRPVLTVETIPEPGTVGLLGLAGIAILFLRRLRSSAYLWMKERSSRT